MIGDSIDKRENFLFITNKGTRKCDNRYYYVLTVVPALVCIMGNYDAKDNIQSLDTKQSYYKVKYHEEK